MMSLPVPPSALTMLPRSSFVVLYPSMAPGRAARGATSSDDSTPSSDSDSGCALEEYTGLQSCNTGMLSLSGNDAKDLQLIQTLLKLLPPQDCDERFYTALGVQERKELHRFNAHRRLHCMKKGVIVPVTLETPKRCCVRCNRRIVAGDTAVCSERIQDEGHWWHIGCFVCDTCHLPLLQFIYFLQDSRIYCGRHHAELTRPRCAACDQLILTEQCIAAEGHHWHLEHFRCWECDAVLGGSRYVMKGGRPFCGECFLHLHAENCETCGDPIDPDGELVTFRGQYWHSLPSCFSCSSCRVPLQLREFTIHDGSLFCSQNCTPCSPHTPNLLTSRSGIESPVRTRTRCPISRAPNRHSHQDPPVIPGSRNCNLSLRDPVTCCSEELPHLHMGPGTDACIPLKGSNRLVEDEDTSCSSSDSEPEGFFLGSPIPNYYVSKANPSLVCGKNDGILKRRQRGRSCKVS
uniref:LIM zinc-binding domain-containing protein n=2 Tax=Leptobrachium leishanense TaxID=445787 RepID=A0A8C5LRW6_9ANUR